AKRHRTVTVPELELALKEFILIYQHRTILSDAIMIEKAKLLADELGLYEEAGSVDEDVITESLPLLQTTRRIAGCKKNKERISVALYANANGSYKLAPLIIGKYAKPQLASGFRPPNVAKAFGPAYVHFLSKNTTSRIQPIDAGIIMAFKRAYHRFHLQWMLEQVEADNLVQDLKMDVLQAIFANLSDDLHKAGDSRLEGLIRSLDTLCLSNVIEIDEFLNFNGEEIVYEVLPEDQIIKELAYVFRNDESVEVIDEGNTEVIDEEEDDSIEPAIVSGNSALNSLENVQMFLLQQEDSGDQLKSINFLEKFIRRMMSSSAQQTRIDEYFKT
ncbi:24248_t:CDS:2, partial [Cetraspora pellucida]